MQRYESFLCHLDHFYAMSMFVTTKHFQIHKQDTDGLYNVLTTPPKSRSMPSYWAQFSISAPPLSDPPPPQYFDTQTPSVPTSFDDAVDGHSSPAHRWSISLVMRPMPVRLQWGRRQRRQRRRGNYSSASSPTPVTTPATTRVPVLCVVVVARVGEVGVGRTPIEHISALPFYAGDVTWTSGNADRKIGGHNYNDKNIAASTHLLCK